MKRAMIGCAAALGLLVATQAMAQTVTIAPQQRSVIKEYVTKERIRPAPRMKERVVVGSGAHGFTFITRREHHLFETPLSWYSRTRTWDLSPGYEHRDYGFNLGAGLMVSRRHVGIRGDVRYFRDLQGETEDNDDHGD